jgi:uncharacterized protein
MLDPPPRYSSRPLPATAYLPGVSSRAQRPAPREPASSIDLIDFGALASQGDFRHGVDLFNHGFPWEAHETWEPLWLAAPRDRPERALLQGLIHAAAAAIKARAGAIGAARGLTDSACDYLSLAGSAILAASELASALRTWSNDPRLPPPTIILATSAGPRAGADRVSTR